MIRSGIVSPKAIGAVVVAHHPSHALLKNVHRLTVQAGLVVVVDNGSAGDSLLVLQAVEKLPKVCVLRNAANLGIAAALNRGIKHALQSGFEWVATFDQDSTAKEEFFQELLSVYMQIPEPGKCYAISPVHIPAGVEPARAAKPRNEFVEMTTVISSGSLFKRSAFDAVGFYDESLFIDYVDFDFCLRLRQKDLKIVQASRVALVHELGKLEHHRLLGFPLTIKSHRAWRRYYIMRNRVLMYRRYGLQFPRWVIRDFGWLLIDLAKITFFEEDKCDKLRNVVKGITHGILGRTGALVIPAA